MTFPLVAGLFVALYCLHYWRRGRYLRAIPTVGYSDPLLSYITARKFSRQAKDLLSEGYDKFQPGLFKIALSDTWMVVAVGEQFVQEVSRAADSVLSMDKAIARTIQADYTVGNDVMVNSYHVHVIRTSLTRNFANYFAGIVEEMKASFETYIPCKGKEWTEISAPETMQKIISRTSNRLFSGLPLCRNEDYIRLNIEFAIDVMTRAYIIGVFPDILKPLANFVLGRVLLGRRRMVEFIGPIVEERLEMLRELGDEWTDRPNDLIQWLIDEAPESHRTVEDVADRMLAVNFAAIHTTSATLTQALYHLATRQEYIEPLREEARSVVAAQGWTKTAMAKMHKIDSFILETQRMNAIDTMSVTRWVDRPFTFSNGVTVPAGTYIGCAALPTHGDDRIYSEAGTFKPFRFSEMHNKEDGEGLKHQMVSAENPNLLHFGQGRHACPGRFFAANELKAILAYVVLNYDIELKGHTDVPPSIYFGTQCVPSSAVMRFRLRS